MVNLDVTRRILTLGAADATTGWYAKSYSTITIKMWITTKGTSFQTGNFGYRAQYPYTGYTDDTISEGDMILDASNRYFHVQTRQPIPLGDSLFCYQCELQYDSTYADRPSTSGTWILESGLNLDPRYRHKKLLDDYLIAVNMKEDDNATNASYITTFGSPDYPLSLVFLGTKNIDLIFCIEGATMTPIRGYDKTPTHNEYDVTISTYAIDKSTITATRLIRAAEHELQRIFETYPTGSIRSIGREESNEQNLGSCILWSKKVTAHYIIGISG